MERHVVDRGPWMAASASARSRNIPRARVRGLIDPRVRKQPVDVGIVGVPATVGVVGKRDMGFPRSRAGLGLTVMHVRRGGFLPVAVLKPVGTGAAGDLDVRRLELGPSDLAHRHLHAHEAHEARQRREFRRADHAGVHEARDKHVSGHPGDAF